MEFQYRKMVQEIADMTLDNATINNIPFREWIDNVNNAYENKKCNLTSCRYNTDGKCTNEEKRKECVRVSKAVLMIDDLVDIETPDNQWIKKKNPFNVCDTNPNCECDSETCGFAVEYSSFEDVSKGIHKYMCGRYKCKYQK